ncbi:WXG100 family type VII secretion target [Microtetraspora niveoalba]|uniref:WXG100 family type VII secretion target n=1 Tax=Microtetraspora niveoalba TaxID=46175 RepID=UPI00082BDC39|nr:WXG100 family type VII secretion target [Microtetraspora niveoalba]
MSAELDFTKVNFGHMELAQGDIVNILKSFEQATADLLTKLQQDLAGHWDGDDGAEAFFREHQRKWDASAVKMRSQLDEIQRAIQIATENYRAAEHRNKSMWVNG